jgi:hypothetical protein
VVSTSVFYEDTTPCPSSSEEGNSGPIPLLIEDGSFLACFAAQKLDSLFSSQLEQTT